MLFFLVLIINKFLLSFSPSRRISLFFLRPPLAATIILDFSLRLTHAFCYPSSLSCETFSPSPSLFLPLSLAPSSAILPRAFLFSLSAARYMHSHSFSPRTRRPSFSLFLLRSFTLLSIARLLFVLFSLLLTPLFLACLFSSPSYLSLSLSLFSISRISLIFRFAFHPPSRSCFRSRRLRALFLSPAVVPPPLCTSLPPLPLPLVHRAHSPLFSLH